MAILGIDEVGRGPLAGPLVVSAVILTSGDNAVLPDWTMELRDSKKLSVKKREKLSELILKEATACGFGFVPASKIDEIGISGALKLATTRAVKSVQRLHTPFSQIIIDGKVNFLKDTALAKYVSTMPKADDLIKEVSAASIIAKVARDHYMYEVAKKYPKYGFESHVGYGTAEHLKAISKFGICPEHRKCFEPIKSMVGFERGAEIRNVVKNDVNVVKNTTFVGINGETAACEYLNALGHEIVVRNFKTKMCEIDIVSICDKKIYFTEVKTRSNEYFGDGLAAVDKKKLSRMKFAVEVFLKTHSEYVEYDPLLAVAAVNGDYKITDFVVIR